jgi:hypothetical protein
MKRNYENLWADVLPRLDLLRFHRVSYCALRNMLLRFLENKICFKGHFEHEGGPEIKIEWPKGQDS